MNEEEEVQRGRELQIGRGTLIQYNKRDGSYMDMKEDRMLYLVREGSFLLTAYVFSWK